MTASISLQLSGPMFVALVIWPIEWAYRSSKTFGIPSITAKALLLVTILSSLKTKDTTKKCLRPCRDVLRQSCCTFSGRSASPHWDEPVLYRCSCWPRRQGARFPSLTSKSSTLQLWQYFKCDSMAHSFKLDTTHPNFDGILRVDMILVLALSPLMFFSHYIWYFLASSGTSEPTFPKLWR
jgi:hypothetical protein